MQDDFQRILKDFYCASLRSHPQKQQKIRNMQSYIAKVDKTFKSTFENTKSNADGQYETQASIGDFENFSFNPSIGHTYTSNLLGPYSQSNCFNQMINNSKVVSKNIFTDPSIMKVIIYAIFINFLHINKNSKNTQNQNHLRYSLRFAQQTVKKLKIAMVTAAQTLKNTDRKKYSKVRYLYDQLTYHIQKSSNFKQEYIKVIIEQFDDHFLQQTFRCLEMKWDQLLYSQSFDSSIYPSDSIEIDSHILQKLDRALEYLHVKMILLKDQAKINEREFCKDLNIVIYEMPNGAYKLNQIVSIRGNQSFISE